MRGPIVMAVARRKLTSLRKDRRTFAFTILVPTIMITLFGIAIGGEPQDLEFGIVIEDPILGQAIAEELKANHSEEFQLEEYDDLADALDVVEDGRSWGALYIPLGFTANIGEMSTNESLRQQFAMQLYLDLSNSQIVGVINTAVQEAFLHVMETGLGVAAGPPIIISDPPIHGEVGLEFIDFLAPGIITLISFMFSMLLTAMSFVNERHDGTLDRVFAAGVRPSEVILGHMVAQSTVLIGQVSILVLVAVYGFNIPLVGPLWLVFVLALTMGMVGMSLGIFISSLARTEFQAFQAAFGSFFPVFLLSGIIWPVQAIPNWIQWASWLFPTTWTADGLRSVMIRGWDLGNFQVVAGLLINLAWIGFFLLLATRSLKTRSADT